MQRLVPSEVKRLLEGNRETMHRLPISDSDGLAKRTSGCRMAMLTSRTQKQRDSRRAGERRGCFMHLLRRRGGGGQQGPLYYHQCSEHQI